MTLRGIPCEPARAEGTTPVAPRGSHLKVGIPTAIGISEPARTELPCRSFGASPLVRNGFEGCSVRARTRRMVLMEVAGGRGGGLGEGEEGGGGGGGGGERGGGSGDFNHGVVRRTRLKWTLLKEEEEEEEET